MPKSKKTKSRSRRSKLFELGFEFIKLQLAGNVPFWGTYSLNFLFDEVMHYPKFQSLLVATVLANALYFIVDDRWVFSSSRKQRNAGTGAWRFVVFMSLNALFTFTITWLLHELFGISVYIGQFISAALSIPWTFIGLRFWVFAPAKKTAAKTKRRPARKLAADRRSV